MKNSPKEQEKISSGHFEAAGFCPSFCGNERKRKEREGLRFLVNSLLLGINGQGDNQDIQETNRQNPSIFKDVCSTVVCNSQQK